VSEGADVGECAVLRVEHGSRGQNCVLDVVLHLGRLPRGLGRVLREASSARDERAVVVRANPEAKIKKKKNN
jgi:hypothetical protein